jgi:hypothetical protein
MDIGCCARRGRRRAHRVTQRHEVEKWTEDFPNFADKANRQFRAQRPNQLWVSDFAYVSSWQGWLYVTFVIDVFARHLVGWQVSSSMRTDFELDALELVPLPNQLIEPCPLLYPGSRTSRRPVEEAVGVRAQLILALAHVTRLNLCLTTRTLRDTSNLPPCLVAQHVS